MAISTLTLRGFGNLPSVAHTAQMPLLRSGTPGWFKGMLKVSGASGLQNQLTPCGKVTLPAQ